MKFSGSIQTASTTVDKIATAATVLLLGSMIVITSMQIIFRFFFTALSWSEEAARYLLVWLTFIGAGCVHKRLGHIAVTSALNLVPPEPRRVLRVVSHLLCMLVFAVMVYYGVLYIRITGAQLSPAMRIPMGYIYLIIPIGGVVLLLHSLSHLTEKRGED